MHLRLNVVFLQVHTTPVLQVHPIARLPLSLFERVCRRTRAPRLELGRHARRLGLPGESPPKRAWRKRRRRPKPERLRVCRQRPPGSRVFEGECLGAAVQRMIEIVHINNNEIEIIEIEIIEGFPMFRPLKT